MDAFPGARSENHKEEVAERKLSGVVVDQSLHDYMWAGIVECRAKDDGV